MSEVGPSRRRWRRISIVLVVLGLLLSIGVALFIYVAGGALGLEPPVVDRVPPVLSAKLGQAELTVLLFSKTSGYRHEAAIRAAERSLRALAKQHGWDLFATENAAVFNDEQLARFDVVFANNTTGDNWTAEQKQAFQRFVARGGGVVGVHGALGTRQRYWDWYTDSLLLGRFVGHPLAPQLQEAAVQVVDLDHPATRHLPRRWMRTDEWYSFEGSARDLGAHVLATLDESSYEPEAFFQDLRMGDHPIIWAHCLGRGRAFYSALGHSAEAYADEAHQQMLRGAIVWAAKREGGCPSPPPSS